MSGRAQVGGDFRIEVTNKRCREKIVAFLFVFLTIGINASIHRIIRVIHCGLVSRSISCFIIYRFLLLSSSIKIGI